MTTRAILIVDADQPDELRRWATAIREAAGRPGGSIEVITAAPKSLAGLAARLSAEPEVWQAVDPAAVTSPAPMAAGPLQYATDGRPDWGATWTTFCELALYGGPPHRGPDNPVLPVSVPTAAAEQGGATEEIRRGIFETTGLVAEDAGPGWLAVPCSSARMAAWLCASIILENVEARSDGNRLLIPADDSFQLTDQVKSVITVLAKTHHYWQSHLAVSATGRVVELIPPDELLTVPPVLDVGGDIGALILYAEPDDFRREVDVSPVTDLARRTHTAIHRRLLNGDTVYVGVYPELAAGTYRLWGARPDQAATVTIEGGAVATIDWRPA